MVDEAEALTAHTAPNAPFQGAFVETGAQSSYIRLGELGKAPGGGSKRRGIRQLPLFSPLGKLAPGGGGCAKILKRTPPTIGNGDMEYGARVALDTCAS